MPAAAREFDSHSCPLVDPLPHGGGMITSGESRVMIGYAPAATVGSACACGPSTSNRVIQGSRTVTIAYKPAARLGDLTAHGGVITSGYGMVIIG